MATVAHTCADLIRRCPTTYANRTQVLHHLFLVLGNGYRWVDGDLVDVTGDGRTEEDVNDTILAALLDVYGEDHPTVTSTRHTLGLLAEANRQRREQADLLALTPGPIDRPIYPIHPGCALETMPDDAADDWRDAALEIVAAVHAHLADRPGPQGV